jgi:hypothetical protein
MAKKQVVEPMFDTACQWWGDLPNIWTPVGWKDHLFRFNVFWNGVILAQPNINLRTEKYKGLGAQFTFIPHYTPDIALNNYAFVRHDDNSVKQGWNDAAAPVLWSEWAKDGVLYRQEVFAHILGGEAVKTGIEPLFAWVRLSVYELCPALPLEDVSGFNIMIQAPFISTRMSMRDNIVLMYGQSDYPRRLHAETNSYDAKTGFRVIEDDDKVRMGIAAEQKCDVIFSPPQKDEDKPYWSRQTYYRLHVKLATKKGAHADLLIPMLPADRAVFDKELALDYDAALKEANKFWAEGQKGRAVFSVPEQFLNETAKHSVRFSEVLAEKSPETGKYCKLNGSFTYADLWATPMAMDLIMMMDMLGYHDVVGKYLEIFKGEQGTVIPPGDSYTLHPGYLSTPALYKSVDWLSDNGAVLYSICEHALLSGDKDFTKRFTNVIIKSCEWIREARAKKGHGGAEGVLPPAVATDRGTKIQAVWSVGWNYKGLTAAVKVLKRIGHPKAAEFEAEAKAYKADFLKAFRAKCRTMPSWKDARGKSHKLVPTALMGDAKDESRHAFYLDAGPLFLVYAGLMDADDPLMKDTLLWFREGPQQKFCRYDSNCWQVPVLHREMSSCEPCYSWNVFFSHQLADREKFFEGMYSLFAGSLSRQTYVSCETRGGVTGNVFSACLAIFLARLAVIDDQIDEGVLHLLRLMPLAWLEAGKEARFEKMPTEFGPVTLKTRVSKDGRTLDVNYTAKFHDRPALIVLHVPPIPGLKTVKVNGKPVRITKRRVLLEV